MTRNATIFVLAAFLLSGITGLGFQNRWAKAEREIKRLPPSAFSELPATVVNELEARGCTIPQVFLEPKPHNVIRGQFARKGQVDWAVLCSRGGKSSIHAFWGKASPCPGELAPGEDRHFLQTIDERGSIGYSRAIYSADADHILKRYKNHGGPKPPPLDHEGIEDAFVEKASGVYYCYQGKWLILQGAD